MDELKPTDLARLADYFAGELSPDEAADVGRWIQQRPELGEFAQTLSRSRIDLSPNASAHIPDINAEVSALVGSFAAARNAERLQAKPASTPLSADITKSASRPESLFRNFSLPPRIGYTVGALAASFLLVFMGWRLAEFRHGILSPESVSTYTTGNGERATVTLPDGSNVILNVGSQLQVPSNFTSGNRTVTLSGQAFFTVVSHSGSPFTVLSGPSITRVLGTRFSVRHYESDTTAAVLVQDGRVSVGSAILTGGQQVVVSSHGEASPIQSVNMDAVSFTQGVLVLDNISLIDALPDLNRWYDVELRLGDSALSDKQIAGGFKSGSISDLVSILELMYDARVERDGRVLTLYPRG